MDASYYTVVLVIHFLLILKNVTKSREGGYFSDFRKQQV